MMADPFEVARQDTQLEVQQTVNETKTTIGNIDDPAGEDTMVGLIKSIPETVPTGAVKSVQRGVIICTQGKKTVDVNISQIDPSKSLLVITSGVLGTPGNTSSDPKSVGNGVVIESVSANKFSITYFMPIGADDGLRRISWQITEYF